MGVAGAAPTSMCACSATAELDPTANQAALLRRGVMVLPPDVTSHSSWLHSHPPWSSRRPHSSTNLHATGSPWRCLDLGSLAARAPCNIFFDWKHARGRPFCRHWHTAEAARQCTQPAARTVTAVARGLGASTWVLLGSAVPVRQSDAHPRCLCPWQWRCISSSKSSRTWADSPCLHSDA